MTTISLSRELKEHMPQLDIGAILLKHHQEVELMEIETTLSRLREDNAKLEAVVNRLHNVNIKLRYEVGTLHSENSKLKREAKTLFLPTMVIGGFAIFFLLSLCFYFLKGTLDIHWSTFALGLIASLGLLGELSLLAYELFGKGNKHVGVDTEATRALR